MFGVSHEPRDNGRGLEVTVGGRTERFENCACGQPQVDRSDVIRDSLSP